MITFYFDNLSQTPLIPDYFDQFCGLHRLSSGINSLGNTPETPMKRILAATLLLTSGLTFSLASNPIDPSAWTTLGSARPAESGLLLTEGKLFQTAAAWNQEAIPADAPFEVTFRFRASDFSSPFRADGFAWVLQGAGLNARGIGHGGIGFMGIPQSVAVKFDSWMNAKYGEKSSESICLMSRGAEENDPNLKQAGLACADEGRIFRKLRWADGRVRTAIVRYDGMNLEVEMDGKPLINHPIGKLSAWLKVAPGTPLYSGFTAATGDTYFQRQEILDYSLSVSHP